MTLDPFDWDPFGEAREAAKAVWQDLKTIDPQPTDEERIDAILDAHTTALAVSGRLIVPELAPTGGELDDTAKWLAEQSDFNRYWSGRNEDGEPVHDGWRELRHHPRHVEVAFAKARARIVAGDSDHLINLATARRVLLSATEQAVGARR